MRLEGMRFHSYHGCLEAERRDGNSFRVDFECEYDMEGAAATDNLARAVDYSAIYDIVKDEMAVPSCLLENVAYRILEAVREAFPQIIHAGVTLHKLNPPVDGPCAESSVTMNY